MQNFILQAIRNDSSTIVSLSGIRHIKKTKKVTVLSKLKTVTFGFYAFLITD